MTRVWKIAFGLGVVLTLGCKEDLPTVPGSPAFEVKDGAHTGGNRHFYFLAPVVSAPSFTGTFDGSQPPEVSICAWTGGACGPLVADFTIASGAGSETV